MTTDAPETDVGSLEGEVASLILTPGHPRLAVGILLAGQFWTPWPLLADAGGLTVNGEPVDADTLFAWLREPGRRVRVVLRPDPRRYPAATRGEFTDRREAD